MYTITEMLNGMWSGTFQVQDGAEMFQENTRKKAIQKMVDCVRIMNHIDITEADMDFVEQEEKVEGISITREDARQQTIDVLVGAMDDLHLANLKLRVSLDSIYEHASHIDECRRIAKEALKGNK